MFHLCGENLAFRAGPFVLLHKVSPPSSLLPFEIVLYILPTLEKYTLGALCTSHKPTLSS
jgi:hypothetical protein